MKREDLEISYLGSDRTELTYYRDYGSDYLDTDNPKNIYPFYRLHIDYDVAIRTNTRLYAYYCKNTNIIYYVDYKGDVRMWVENVDTTPVFEDYNEPHPRYRKALKAVEDFILERDSE